MNPFVFIVGCPRSGTTLLQRMVNAHPKIAVTLESHWIARCFEDRGGLTPENNVTPELASRLVEDARFARWCVDRDGLLALMGKGGEVAYSCFVKAIFDLYGEAQGKTLVGNKTPAFVRRLDMLHSLWPTARFVHLIRDGRAVSLSMANWPKTYQPNKPGSLTTWAEHPVSTMALWWELNIRQGRQGGESLGSGLYYEMRYESLVSHPREECASLCAFLGLTYDDAMLRFHEGRTRAAPGRDAKHAWLPVTPGLRDWRSQMPAEDVERFEAAAGDLLDELGYPRAFPSPRQERIENAAKVRDLLSRDPRWLNLSRAPRAV